ncbi:hypothetical protein Mevan_0165 [Methanococcus vannielii SB]|jgi:hypothetical protein|uniref:S-layer protein outer domain-containing protein n=1 Tax=Methanococcus vannielii (strain ATCC 35089 / DSM 1224 / JCM 13029 / OCM 148 / SB) TaxID=406327 RepID=A6UNK4_METVS|nr:S-layer protein [Methanococcus vannielii]ABR54076.1 hypothetical protein Mevan_0165 [Methanococcus vannielii SB]
MYKKILIGLLCLLVFSPLQGQEMPQGNITVNIPKYNVSFDYHLTENKNFTFIELNESKKCSIVGYFDNLPNMIYSVENENYNITLVNGTVAIVSINATGYNKVKTAENCKFVGWNYTINHAFFLVTDIYEMTTAKIVLTNQTTSDGDNSSTDPPSNNNRRGGSGSVTTDQTEISKNVISSIKSEKIKQILSNAKVVAGNTVDYNYAANLRTDSMITTVSELNQDTVIVGGPLANPYAKMYDNKFDLKITNDYPGENKGVIQVKEINGYMVIYIAGSDRFGTLAALEYFKTLDELPEKPLIIEWTSTGSKLIK